MEAYITTYVACINPSLRKKCLRVKTDRIVEPTPAAPEGKWWIYNMCVFNTKKSALSGAFF